MDDLEFSDALLHEDQRNELYSEINRMAQKIDRLNNSEPHPKFIEHCEYVFDMFRADHPKHWVRYVRGKRKKLSVNTQAIVDIAKSTSQILPTLIPDQTRREIVDFGQRMFNQETADSRHPRGVVMFAVIDGQLFAAASMCNFAAGDRWNKYIGRYYCVRQIVRGAQQKTGGVLPIDTDATWTDSTCENAWARQMPEGARQTAFDLFKSIIGKLSTNAANREMSAT